MAQEIHRKGDLNVEDAAVLSTQQTKVKAGSEYVATDGDPVDAHGSGVHASPVTANGSPSVSIEGRPINRKDDPDNCTHPRADGLSSVIVGDTGSPTIVVPQI